VRRRGDVTLAAQRLVDRRGGILDRAQRRGQRGGGGGAALLAPRAVEHVHERAIARDQLLEARERRRWGAGRTVSGLARERVRALEGIGELGHALRGEAPARDEIDGLARDRHHDLGVRAHPGRVRAPETADDCYADDAGDCLDPWGPAP
jgi:hypothetical protein